MKFGHLIPLKLFVRNPKKCKYIFLITFEICLNKAINTNIDYFIDLEKIVYLKQR